MTQPIPPHRDVEILSQTRVWSGRFPLDKVEFRHRRFDGTMSDNCIWELWRRRPAVALLPYDPRTNQVVLIEHFRLPALAAGIDPLLVELPAGLCQPNEDPAETIKREKMAFDADRTEKIGAFLLTAGGADEFCHLYAGRVAVPPHDTDGSAGLGGEATEAEDIRSRIWSANQAIKAALTGCFTNSVTALALLWLASQRSRLRQIWSVA